MRNGSAVDPRRICAEDPMRTAGPFWIHCASNVDPQWIQLGGSAMGPLRIGGPTVEPLWIHKKATFYWASHHGLGGEGGTLLP